MTDFIEEKFFGFLNDFKHIGTKFSLKKSARPVDKPYMSQQQRGEPNSTMSIKFRTMIILAVGVTLGLMAGEVSAETAAATEPSSGEVIGDVVAAGSKDMARGVAIASHSTADTLDGLTWAGCSMAKWAVGEKRDRTASIGNTVVGLVFRLPVSALGSAVCATSAVLAMPVKGIGYGFDTLTGDGN